ncbi:hypothetical protein F383_11925 [Gossypium arboreum]|uniref:Uncharacterized protein n=1 Tax=Gossypium arboreum TaxID=29729 RepID=A0A0B0NAA3_GOSAR|nr:hypothetical protein F383_11925 [Gossypium arboreum]
MNEPGTGERRRTSLNRSRINRGRGIHEGEREAGSSTLGD